MPSQQEQQGPPPDSGPVALVTTTGFPVLHLKIPIKIPDLSTFAEAALAMIISHMALHRVTCLLRLVPANSRCLLGMFRGCSSVEGVDAGLERVHEGPAIFVHVMFAKCRHIDRDTYNCAYSCRQAFAPHLAHWEPWLGARVEKCWPTRI